MHVKAKPSKTSLLGTYSARSPSLPKTYRSHKKPKHTCKQSMLHSCPQHCRGVTMKESHLYQGCGPQADSTSSPRAADALCTAGGGHGKPRELYSVEKRQQYEQRGPEHSLKMILVFQNRSRSWFVMLLTPIHGEQRGPPKRPITTCIKFLRDPWERNTLPPSQGTSHRSNIALYSFLGFTLEAL